MSANMGIPLGLKMCVAALAPIAEGVVVAQLAPALGAERFVVAMVMASLIGAALAWGSLRSVLAAIPGVLLVVPYVALTVWQSAELRTPVGQAEVILAPVLVMVMASVVLSTFPRSEARPTANQAQP